MQLAVGALPADVVAIEARSHAATGDVGTEQARVLTLPERTIQTRAPRLPTRPLQPPRCGQLRPSRHNGASSG